jgi:Flp pilus assembly protein TadG
MQSGGRIMMKRFFKNQRGAALIETAVTLPLVLLVSVSIFEFGRAYQTWQVLTNAAREGARVSILTDQTDSQVTAAVRNYMTSGRLPSAASAPIVVERSVAFGGNTASRITINYPFNFMVLSPVAKLVQRTSSLGQGTLTMSAVAMMRNES